MKHKETLDNKQEPDFKYLRLLIPIDLHRRLQKYQALKLIHEDRKESLAVCIVELLDEAIEDIK